MASNVRVAVPSDAPGGLEALRSGHFGHCDCFTVIDVEEGEAKGVEIVQNPPHDGNCFAPIQLLAGYGVQAIVVYGMGMRPWMGFRQSGVEVYLGVGERVGESLAAFARGELPVFGENHTCGGGGGHAEGGGGGCGGHG